MKRLEIDETSPVPAFGARGTVVPHDWRNAGSDERGAPLQLKLARNAEAARNGEFMLRSVKDLVATARRGDLTSPKIIRELYRLLQLAPNLVLRSEDFLRYFHELYAKGLMRAIVHLVGATKRGRPHEQAGYVVTLVDQIVELEGVSVAKACHLLREIPNSPFAHVTVDRMRNIYSERRDETRAARSYFADRQDLVQAPPALLEEFLGVRWR